MKREHLPRIMCGNSKKIKIKKKKLILITIIRIKLLLNYIR